MRLHAVIAPMLAKAVERLPAGRPGEYVYEPKLDGFRCLAIIDRDRGVQLQSRHGARFNDLFPEVMWAVFEHLPPATVVDGEIVRWSQAGRLDFAGLQHRNVAGRHAAEQLARSQPCHFVVFDLLRLRGRDLTGRPLQERRSLLEELFTTVPAAGVLALGMQTADEREARIWYTRMHAVGIEGLVIKLARSRYECGGRGWLKLKYRATTEAIVGGITGKRRRPNELLLGRYDRTGRLRVVGRTTRLNTELAAQVAPLLTLARSDHPWPAELPPGWAGAAYGRRDPIAYTRVEPDVVVEVLADVAIEHGRFRHAVRLVRPRTDMHASQVVRVDDVEPLLGLAMSQSPGSVRLTVLGTTGSINGVAAIAAREGVHGQSSYCRGRSGGSWQ